MTHFLYLVRHGEAAPHDGPLSPAGDYLPSDPDSSDLPPSLASFVGGSPAAVRPPFG
jgi:hypothetical protein